MFKYLQRAFTHHWNLLIFLGACGFALLSPRPDVWLPLVVAGEVAYLGTLASHPRFQAYVEAQERKRERGMHGEVAQRQLDRILESLPRSAMERFDALRTRCLELRQIMADIKPDPAIPADRPLDELQVAGLDKLLWIFLRMLFTEYSLARFLEKTSPDRLQKDIDHVQDRIRRAQSAEESEQRQKILATLDDHLKTCHARLENFRKAQDNHTLVQLELDRLENKIRSLSELAVNRQEPQYISGEVNAVADRMLATEKTLNDLEFATGLSSATLDVPPLLNRIAATTFSSG